MPFVALEIVRDVNGEVINILSIDDGEILPAQPPSFGYVQVIDGKVVQYFRDNEIVIASVRER